MSSLDYVWGILWLNFKKDDPTSLMRVGEAVRRLKNKGLFPPNAEPVIHSESATPAEIKKKEKEDGTTIIQILELDKRTFLGWWGLCWEQNDRAEDLTHDTLNFTRRDKLQSIVQSLKGGGLIVFMVHPTQRCGDAYIA